VAGEENPLDYSFSLFIFNIMSACDICSNKCFGIDGYDGSCCSIEDRDWIIGPITDTDEFIQRLSNKLGRPIPKEDIFYELEEGKNIFPNKPTWQMPSSYPALKINLEDKKKACIFYNTTLKACTMYDIRPTTCQNFECGYLKENK